MQPDLHYYANAAWVVIGLFWAAGAVATKRTERVQSGGSRLLHLLLATAGFTLAFRPMHVGFLGRQVLPDSTVIAYVGLALTIAGIGFAVWARALLGRNWSALVTIKEGHTIVRSGPYAIVRHPIYSSGLLALLGTAMVVGELRSFVAIVLVSTAWWWKLRLEEKFMAERFGEQYLRYQREVKALIPFIL